MTPSGLRSVSRHHQDVLSSSAAALSGVSLPLAAAKWGLAVTIVESEGAPMRRALGQRIGAFMTTVIRDYGVDLRLGDAVERIEAGSASTVAAVILRDGTRIDTDLVIVALGAQRNVEWLEGSGLLTSSRGLRCDAFCRALKGDGSPAPGVFAAGDVAHCAGPANWSRAPSLPAI